ncbi:MAG TPA: pyridoxamine 5'-phosphate oxidase family protein [Candidatus Angelobacter sp.]
MMNLTKRTKLRRLPNRGSHQAETIHAILDAGFLAHVGFQVDGQPFVIPTLYGRDGDKLYLHGSAASRMLGELETSMPVCINVTLVDGLVLARSAFHHSMKLPVSRGLWLSPQDCGPGAEDAGVARHLRTCAGGPLE